MFNFTSNKDIVVESKSIYIFREFKWDFLFLILPAALIYFLLATSVLDGTSALLAFLTFVAFDTGHSMSTFVRMQAVSGEWKSSKRYFIMPVVIFAVIFLWVELQIPYLFSFVVYYSAYHYMRQHWGILRWYEKINNDQQKWRKIFLYASFILPFVAFHFGVPSIQGVYSEKDFITFPQADLYFTFLGISVLTFLAWVIFEIKSKTYQHDRGMWILLLQIFIHNLALLFGKDTWQVFGPLITMHSISYFLLTQKVYESNVAQKSHLKWMLGILLAILFLAGPLRMLEAYQEETGLHAWWDGLLLALVVTPGLVHYHFDSFLWRHTHPAFARVLKR